MTLKDLYKYSELNTELQRLNRKLQFLREEAAAPKSPNISGMPKSKSNVSKIEADVSKILTAEEQLKNTERKCLSEKKKLDKYINAITDDMLQDIFTYRFIYSLSWREIAFKVGGYNTEDSVKKMCYRYIQSH